MTTITAKEFRTNQTDILKNVRQGKSYLLTSHRRPIARLMPVQNTTTPDQPPRGSYAAVLASLEYTRTISEKDLQTLSYKQLRDRVMQAKYGDGQVYKRR